MPNLWERAFQQPASPGRSPSPEKREPDRRLAIGDEIKVVRSSGVEEPGWKIVSINEKDGEVVVVKPEGTQLLRKSIPLKEAVRRQTSPERREQGKRLKVGDEVSVVRSSGEAEAGWKILNIDDTSGDVVVAKDQEGQMLRKNIPQLELYFLNMPESDVKFSIPQWVKFFDSMGIRYAIGEHDRPEGEMISIGELTKRAKRIKLESFDEFPPEERKKVEGRRRAFGYGRLSDAEIRKFTGA